jgi:hypothetical protein
MLKREDWNVNAKRIYRLLAEFFGSRSIGYGNHPFAFLGSDSSPMFNVLFASGEVPFLVPLQQFPGITNLGRKLIRKALIR